MKKITLDREARERLARQFAESLGRPVEVAGAVAGSAGE